MLRSASFPPCSYLSRLSFLGALCLLPSGCNGTSEVSGDGIPPMSSGGDVATGGSATVGTGGTTGGATGGASDGGVPNSPSDGSRGNIEAGTGGQLDPSSGGLPPIDDSPPLPVDELPVIEEMPDPLTMNDGTPVTTQEQWARRRQEMIKILEDYTYGHMPPPPGNVTGAAVGAPGAVTAQGTTAEFQRIHLTFGPDASLGFDLGLFLPREGDSVTVPDGGFPVLISLTFSSGANSLGRAAAALARGYAVVTIGYQELGEDSPNYRSSAFFPAYPDYDWRDISAWAWGLSRAVDYLVTDDAIDPEKIMMTGVSRTGQAVLLAGAFDERVALSAPVAGGMAFRFSGAEMGGGLGQGITEIVDQNTYWFGPLFEEFRNRTELLPSDQHWLPALTAPRLFILCNSLADPYGRAYAAAQSYLGAKPVYEFLSVPDHLGQHFRPGGHGDTAEDWTAILDFADQYLLGKPGDRRFDELPPADQLP